MKPETQTKLTRLKEILQKMNGCAVAYSGGVDSTLLITVAYQVLGDRALAVTAISPIYPVREFKESEAYAQRLGIKQVVIYSEELDIGEFAENPPDRCYFCKKNLFQKIQRIAKDHNVPCVCDGSNADDTSDYRPGTRARKELGVRSPLQEVGLTKQEIRELSRSLHLPTGDKPAFACLASRFPYGTAITRERLKQVEDAEEFLFSLHVHQCRVRYHETLARIEVLPMEFPVILSHADVIVKRFKTLGFQYITLDLQGYRTGSLNEVLPG